MGPVWVKPLLDPNNNQTINKSVEGLLGTMFFSAFFDQGCLYFRLWLADIWVSRTEGRGSPNEGSEFNLKAFRRILHDLAPFYQFTEFKWKFAALNCELEGIFRKSNACQLDVTNSTTILFDDPELKTPLSNLSVTFQQPPCIATIWYISRISFVYTRGESKKQPYVKMQYSGFNSEVSAFLRFYENGFVEIIRYGGGFFVMFSQNKRKLFIKDYENPKLSEIVDVFDGNYDCFVRVSDVLEFEKKTNKKNNSTVNVVYPE